MIGIFSKLLPTRIKSGQLVYFTKQLSVMLKAGFPLVRALHTLSSQISDYRFARIVSSIAIQVEQGDKLSEAFQRYPAIFPPYYINMVRVAETGGILDEIFRRLALFMEKQYRIKKKVISAFAYPIFILVVAIVILLIIMAVVVPSFMKMFKEYGEDLPTITKTLLLCSNWLREKWWIGGIFAVGGVIVVSLLVRVPVIAYWVDRILLRVPGIGGILRRFYVSRFAQTLGTLLASGVPIIKALEVVRDTMGNRVFRSVVHRLIFAVEEGDDMSSFLRLVGRGVFPPLVIEMISIGEESGTLSAMLLQIADTYEEEIDLIVSSLSSVIEPFLIVFIGLVVGFIVIAMFMPLFSLTQIMSQ